MKPKCTHYQGQCDHLVCDRKAANHTYRVWFTNHEYFSQHEHGTLEEAVRACRAASFEATVYRDGEPVVFWSPISGCRRIS